jgi:hypothetical protein
MGINFDQSIKDMAPGHFWAHPQSLGLSESDLAYGYSQIEAPPLVKERIERVLLDAVETLEKAPVGQPLPFDPDDIFVITGKPS